MRCKRLIRTKLFDIIRPTMFFILASVFSSTVLASSYNLPTVQELTAEADHVLVGTVGSISSLATHKKGKKAKKAKNRNKADLANIEKVFTDIELVDVVDLVKKKNNGKIKYKIRYFGGVVPYTDEQTGNERERVFVMSKTPQFLIGERVLIFVKGNGRKALPFPSEYESVFKIGKDDEIYTHNGVPVVSIDNDVPVILREGFNVPVDREYSDDGSFTLTFDSAFGSVDNIPRFTLSTSTDHLRLTELSETIRSHVAKLGKKEKEFVLSSELVAESEIVNTQD